MKENPRRPLDGISVIETGNSEAAGMCTLLLSDFGADVILITPSTQAAGTAQAVPVRVCDRGKRREAFDLSREEEKARFLFLIGSCDVLVDGCAPGELEDLGFTRGALLEWNPTLIYTAVTPYGTQGPMARRAWSEAAVQAEAGWVSVTGEENKDPVRCGGDIATFTGGMNACIAVLMGILQRNLQQKGCFCDVSMMDSLIYGLENQLSISMLSGTSPRPRGNHYALSAPVGNFPCKDGELMISVATEAQFAAFAEVLGREDWLEKPEYYNVSRRLANHTQLEAEVSEEFSKYTCQELMQLLQKKSCVYGKINDFEAVARHPQAAARNTFIDVNGSDGSVLRMPCNPIMIDGGRMYRDGILVTDENEEKAYEDFFSELEQLL